MIIWFIILLLRYFFVKLMDFHWCKIDLHSCKFDFNSCKIDLHSGEIGFHSCKIEFHLCKIEFRLCKVDFHLCKLEFHLWKLEFHLCKIEFHLCKIGLKRVYSLLYSCTVNNYWHCIETLRQRMMNNIGMQFNKKLIKWVISNILQHLYSQTPHKVCK